MPDEKEKDYHSGKKAGEEVSGKQADQEQLDATLTETKIETLEEGNTGNPESQDSDNVGIPKRETRKDKTDAGVETTTSDPKEVTSGDTPEKEDDDSVHDDPQGEIDESNAEDAEDNDNQRRHHIPLLDYHAMSMENLVGELQRLLRHEKVQAIKKHVDGIKYEFDLKFQEFTDQKKEEFVAQGGNEADFRYNSIAKRQFDEVYREYRDKRNQYYKNLEKTLKENLSKRLEIIEQLKALVNVEEDINTTYKNFKELQQRWREAGAVPRSNYNDVWRTYHHHLEIFYDFLHLNRELRDLDFKHNLEEKQKLIERAEALVGEKDLGKAFRELQTLHKIWKEDIGPVDKEYREQIWDQFSNATKALHQRRQEHYQELEKSYEQNLVKKNEIIEAIGDIAGKVANNHRDIQKQIKEVEALRDRFFKGGKVPQQHNDKTWTAFKEAVRAFNRKKNAYYKNLKKEQQENLTKKRALVDRAIALKDSDEWDTVTPEMKRIQSEWKKIGHVPRKYSDKIWKQFKEACNHYFDRLHALKDTARKKEGQNLEKKNDCIERLETLKLSGDRRKDLETIKGFIAEWRSYGRVPFKKKQITQKFNKTLDAHLKKLGVNRQEAELLKYGNKIQQLANAENERALANERHFIRKKIDESKGEIRQLENNLEFFSNASEENPLVQEVIKKVEEHKEALATWKAKLKKLNIMENTLSRQADEEDVGTASPEEE